MQNQTFKIIKKIDNSNRKPYTTDTNLDFEQVVNAVQNYIKFDYAEDSTACMDKLYSAAVEDFATLEQYKRFDALLEVDEPEDNFDEIMSIVYKAQQNIEPTVLERIEACKHLDCFEIKSLDCRYIVELEQN